MSVIVKGMEMPKNCGKCPMMRPGNYKGHAFPCTCHAKDCFPIKPSELDLRDGLCPLVKVPTPHGRLIDADKLRAEFPHPNDWRNPELAYAHLSGIWATIDCAETIIEVEEER